MPELPEVETIRRDLAPALEGATIVSVRIQKPDIIMSGESPRTFAASLRGRHISARTCCCASRPREIDEPPCFRFRFG